MKTSFFIFLSLILSSCGKFFPSKGTTTTDQVQSGALVQKKITCQDGNFQVNLVGGLSEGESLSNLPLETKVRVSGETTHKGVKRTFYCDGTIKQESNGLIQCGSGTLEGTNSVSVQGGEFFLYGNGKGYGFLQVSDNGRIWPASPGDCSP